MADQLNPSDDFIKPSFGFDPRRSRSIALLEVIAETGSINRAAQRLGMSYKAAWEQVDLLNNLSNVPLLSRTVGGRGGGGTEVTAAGLDLIRKFRRIEHEYQRFMAFAAQDGQGSVDTYKMIRRMEMSVSARNIWSGQVRSISSGEVNTAVEVALRGGERVVAVVTSDSLDALGLTEGSEVLALVKASAVLLARDLRPDQVSACNLLSGRVARLVEGRVNCDVCLDLAGGNTVSATVTRDSAARLGLQVGGEASALIKASSVLLAVS